ncbi:MAG TPA: plastocyanin/azurin family copper-binding protein [Gemmatimonadales bacterium]|nr:plastocyanin/azurin family copper-binding protein [Gemmatimonadales bacterium]
MRRRGVGLLVLGSLVWLGAACGDDQGPSQPPLVVQKPATKSGDGQNGPVGTALGNPLRILITREGEPVEGVDVNWSAAQGGTLSDEQQSGEDGVASVVWTLGPEIGVHVATASVEGAEGSPLTYTATATEGNGPPPGPTVQVLNNEFDPGDITIVVGETVTWVWPEGSGLHNVLPDNLNTPERSGVPEAGPASFSYTFDQIGTFRYYCQVHGAPNGSGMSGRVIVLATPP